MLRGKRRIVEPDGTCALQGRRWLGNRRVVLNTPEGLHQIVSQDSRQQKHIVYLSGALDTEQPSILRHDVDTAAIAAISRLILQTVTANSENPIW